MIRIERRRRKAPGISIAPLVDCVFLLLIFFLLTSTFLEKHGMEIEVPRSGTAAREEAKTFEIFLSKTGEITFGGAKRDLGGLAAALAEAVTQRGKLPVFLVADRRVSLEAVAGVIDCARESGLERVSIATRRAP